MGTAQGDAGTSGSPLKPRRQRVVRWLVLLVLVVGAGLLGHFVAGPILMLEGARTGNMTAVKVGWALAGTPNVWVYPVGGWRAAMERHTIVSNMRFAGHSSRQLLPVKVTPLQAAVSGAHLDIAKWLLDRGANPDWGTEESPDGWGSSLHGQKPLLSAVRQRDLAMIDLLCARGADLGPQSRQNQYRTPLHVAASMGDVTVADALLRHGADLHAYDAGSWTPLSWAAYQGHDAMVKFLLEEGADPNGEGHQVAPWMYHKHMTPLRIAEYQRHDACARVLRPAGAESAIRRDPSVSKPVWGPDSVFTAQQHIFEEMNFRKQAARTGVPHATRRGRAPMTRP